MVAFLLRIMQICETVELFPGLSLSELSATICEHLGWHTAAGGLKEEACKKLLGKLEGAGLVKLPQKRGYGGGKRTVTVSSRTDAGEAIRCSLKELKPVRIELVKTREEKELWNEYVEKYHPLGYKQPFGYRMRYFITSGRGRLGCVIFSGAAKSLGTRDRWIGWSEEQRLQRLAWVINNSRYLVFPWVEVPNLSSHAWGKLASRVAQDWEDRWGYRPVLMETFVDPKYEGSCYKAVGWRYVGMTTGEGLVREGKTYSTTPKRIFMKPLIEDFRSVLCSELPEREEEVLLVNHVVKRQRNAGRYGKRFSGSCEIPRKLKG